MRTGRRRDAVLSAVTTSAAALSAIVIILVIGFVLVESAPLLLSHGVLGFFADDDWSPRDGHYSVVPMIAGSFIVVFGAMLISTPVGLLCGVLSALYAPAAGAHALRLVYGVLAGIPSVVYGYGALTIVVPRIYAWQPPGVSLLAGVLVLAFMLLPTMALLSDAALRAVPVHMLRGAAAVGLSRPAIIWGVAVPHARRGLAAAALLQVARAVGETLAVLMVMGNTIQMPGGAFDAARALTAHIALEMAYALGDHRRGLFVGGLLLLLVVVALVALADRIEERSARSGAGDA